MSHSSSADRDQRPQPVSAGSDLATQERLALKHRLSLCYDYLKHRESGFTYNDIAKATGIKPVTVRAAFAPSVPYVSDKFVTHFIEAYGKLFREEWIRAGEGSMVRADAPPPLSQTERWQRVQLIMEREKLSIEEMSHIIRANRSTIYRIVVEHRKPQDVTLRKIVAAFPMYRPEWLIDGRGAPTDTEENQRTMIITDDIRSKSSALPYSWQETMHFPLVNTPARAGVLTGYGDDANDLMPNVVIPVERIYRGEYRIFEVQGVSMDDGTLMSLAEGDLVLARKVDRQYWADGLHIHKWLYFIFVTQNDGILIKQVKEQDLKRGLITLHSLNHRFPDQVIDLREVDAIYNVIQVILRKLNY